MCGIFTFQSKNPKKTNWKEVIANIKILGLYNDTRGGDNFGIYLNGNIHKNKTHSEKTAKTFFENNGEIFDLKDINFPNIIGHSRKGSVGGLLLENAHPFVIETENDKLIGVHNGTIKNWKELLDEYNLKDDKIKVDSQAIFTILANNKDDYSVFEKYDGAGTFIWMYESDPDSLYTFKGASKLYQHSAAVTEERPLYFYEADEGIYFSSMAESLKCIAFKKEDVKNLKSNSVFKLTKGVNVFEKNINRVGIFELPKITNVINSSSQNNTKTNIQFNHTIPINNQLFKIVTKATFNRTSNPSKLYTKIKAADIILDGIYIINSLTGAVLYEFPKYDFIDINTIKDKYDEIKKATNSNFISPIFVINGDAIYNNYYVYYYVKAKIKDLIKIAIEDNWGHNELSLEIAKLQSQYSLSVIRDKNTNLYYFDNCLFNGSVKFLFNDSQIKYTIINGIPQNVIADSGPSFIKTELNGKTFHLNLEKELENTKTTWASTYPLSANKLTFLKNEYPQLFEESNCCNLNHEDQSKIESNSVSIIKNTKAQLEIQGFGKDFIISKEKDNSIENDEELENKNVINDTLSFMNEENLLLETYNELVDRTRKIISISEKLPNLKIKDFKNHLSYILSDWVLNVTENQLLHSSNSLYKIDEQKKSTDSKFNFNFLSHNIIKEENHA